MLRRLMLVSQMREGSEDTLIALLQSDAPSIENGQSNRITRYSIFRHEKLLFVYVEHESIEPLIRQFWSERARALLEPWPGLTESRYAIPLNDIYHDDEPSEDVPWRRSGYQPDLRVGSITRLRPDMYASYVFLHYQLQEEKPRQFNKYYMIGSFEQYLFSYQELPEIVEKPRRGKLTTEHSPQNWSAVMQPHFEPWPDTVEDNDEEDIWRKLVEIISK